MSLRSGRGLSIIAVAVSLATSASAHHSTSAYDFTKTMKLQGSVKSFQWTNPHSWLELAVGDSQGGSTTWTLESGTPNVNKRMGWTGADVKPGDKVEVTIHPKRDGSNNGALMYIRLPNGKTLQAPASLFGDKAK